MAQVMRHASLCKSRADGFSSRGDLLEETVRKIGSCGGVPTVVYGESGTGKTSLLAKAAQEVGAMWTARAIEAESAQLTWGRRAVVITRFCGITPASNDARSLLRSLCEQLSIVYDEQPTPVADSYRELVKEFKDRLVNSPSDRPLGIFIDSLDQLTNDYMARSDLLWLPTVRRGAKSPTSVVNSPSPLTRTPLDSRR